MGFQAQAVVDRVVELTEKLVVGDPTDREVYMGPVINRSSYQDFQDFTEEASQAGTFLTSAEQIQAIMEAAEETESPVIVQASRGARKYSQDAYLKHLMLAAVDPWGYELHPEVWLLVGAVMTQRPELFGACLPAVGVMDMLRFHKFTSGRYWVDDYGSSDDPEQFRALYAYSPYHNLKPGTRYPATLVTTADTDDRVIPAHSFKFAARLQEAHAGTAPVLIRIETRAGHGSGKYSAYRKPLRLHKNISAKVALPWARTMVQHGTCAHELPGKPKLSRRMRSTGFRFWKPSSGAFQRPQADGTIRAQWAARQRSASQC